jgi:hypothetical protein
VQRKGSIPQVLRKVISRLVFAAAATGAMQAAHAGCGQYEAAARPANYMDGFDSQPRFIRTAFQTVSDESPDWTHAAAHAPITGLWYFKYLSKGNIAFGIPDGAQIDGGNTTWYADGNEMTSSAFRAPNTGSICLGVWKRTGESSYELNHIGLSWDPVKNVFAGPAFIKQYVVLERGGDKYAGTFTIRQFAADGKTLDVELKGMITATRVTVETDKQLP